MSDVEHTPGPWRISTTPCDLYSEWCISPESDSGIIATARYFHGKQAAANARLIASSPDLLVLLQEVLAGTTVFGSSLECDTGFDGEQWAARAKDAIAKATGHDQDQGEME